MFGRNKMLLPVLLAFSLCLLFLPAAHAEGIPQVSMLINGKTINADQGPVIESGKVLVPFRALCEELGAAVTWNNDERRAYATKGDIEVVVCIPCEFININDERQKLDLSPRIVNDRVMIPLNVVNGLFGSSATWTAGNNQILVSSAPLTK